MTTRVVRIGAALATLVAVLSCSGSDGVAPPPSVARPDSLLLAGLYASGPLAAWAIAADRVDASGSAAAGVEVSWISLIPGTLPDGTTATIVNRRTAQRITTAILDGGFDPLPISASVGDTVEVSASRVGEPDAAAVMAVIARPAPRIVRTRPPRGQTDVPLNTVITLVFSEPLNAASVNSGSVRLTTAGSPVAGQARLQPGPGYVVEFTPSALLAPSTTYSLTVSGVVNLAGTLAAPTSVNFTTAATVGSGTARMPLGQAVREIPVDSHFIARGLWASSTGTGLPTTWRSRDSSIATVEPWGNSVGLGYVLGIRAGSTVIEGSALGVTTTIAVTVLAPAPALAVSPVTVDFRVLELQDASSHNWFYTPEIVLTDSTGRGGSAIVAVSFDIPGFRATRTCVMDRAIGSDPLEVFRETYGDFELYLAGDFGQRASGSEVVAHVTLRIPGPAAMSIDVRGPIVPGAFPTTYTGGWGGTDVLSCG